MIDVINKYKTKEKLKGIIIYGGRPSDLGNPYILGVDGNRETVIERYRTYFNEEIKNKKSKLYLKIQKILELAKDNDIHLVCFCKPLDCHLDIVKEYLDNQINKEIKK